MRSNKQLSRRGKKVKMEGRNTFHPPGIEIIFCRGGGVSATVDGKEDGLHPLREKE